jgi:hypothetical protein
MPKGKIKQSLDDLETVSKEMDRYGIPKNPTVDPTLSKLQRRVRAIAKTMSMGLMYTNPVKKMIGNAALGMIPNPNADALALKGFKGAAQMPGQSLSGVGVTGALGANINNQTR